MLDLEAIFAALTDDLRRPPYAGHPNPLRGHCYHATEALWHLLGRPAGLYPHVVRMPSGETHWYLDGPYGRVDLTFAQYTEPVPYHCGRGCGFLTRQPSKRAQTIIDRVSAC